MPRAGQQHKLFDTAAQLPEGLVYAPEFITAEEEELLLMFIEANGLRRAQGGPSNAYEARRRYAHFGWSYDLKHGRLKPGPPLPRFLQRFAHRIEKWRGWPRGRVVEALVNEYAAGAAIGFHRDNEPFAHVVGISLGGWARMKFRPLRPGTGGPEKISTLGPTNASSHRSPSRELFRVRRRPADVFSLELEPRSAYVMQGAIRWHYQHSIAATRALRYSITFRTLPESMPIPKAR